MIAITGVRYQTLNLWAKNGLIRPSIKDAEGRGTEREYSFEDLVSLKVAVALRDGGVTTKSLLRVVRFLQGHSEYAKPLSEARLIVRGRDVIAVLSSDDLISTLRSPGQSVFSFVVDVDRVVNEVLLAASQQVAAA